MPALLNEASFFGLTGLEAALQVVYSSETLQLNNIFYPMFLSMLNYDFYHALSCHAGACKGRGGKDC